MTRRRRAATAAVAVVALAATDSAAAASRDTVTLAWGGDLTLGSSYGLPPARGWPQLAPVAPVLRRADLAAVNYEGTFGSRGSSKCGVRRSATCFAFQAPAANAATLARAGVDIVNLANNHAFDFGPLGWRDTRAALDRAEVRATGAPGELRVLDAGGRRVAFVGFSNYRWSAPLSDGGEVRSLVRRAARRADIVVALFHGGAEGADELHVPAEREHAFGEDRGDLRRFARHAIDAGADVVLGSGPHVLRGMQLYRRRLIAYSLGNLSGWRNFATGGTLSYSALLTVELAPGGRLVGGRVTSLVLDRIGVPHVDPARSAERLMQRLSRSDFGASAVWFEPLGSLRPETATGLAP